MGSSSTVSRSRSGTGRNAKDIKSVAMPKVAKVTVGELRSSFKSVEKKLARGMRVQVTRRGEVVAEMLPARTSGGETEPVPSQKKNWLDLLEEHRIRMHEIWGDQVVDIDTTALISEGRDRDFLL